MARTCKKCGITFQGTPKFCGKCGVALTFTEQEDNKSDQKEIIPSLDFVSKEQKFNNTSQGSNKRRVLINSNKINRQISKIHDLYFILYILAFWILFGLRHGLSGSCSGNSRGYYVVRTWEADIACGLGYGLIPTVLLAVIYLLLPRKAKLSKIILMAFITFWSIRILY